MGSHAKDVFDACWCCCGRRRFKACFVKLVAVFAGASERGDRRGATRFRSGRQDGASAAMIAKKGLGALHSVTVWASDFGLSLGQVACAEKSNEITAIPELLRLVDIKGTIITIDANGNTESDC